jgi:hypothetical protein
LTVWCYCVRDLCDVLTVWCYCARDLCDVLTVWCYCVRDLCDVLTVWCYCARDLCDVLTVWCYCARDLCDVLTVWCYCVMALPWGWQECRPKYVGENFVNKIHHKYWNTYVGCLYILDHVNAQQMKHTKSSRSVYSRHSGTLLLHQHLLLHLPMNLAPRKFIFFLQYSL